MKDATEGIEIIVQAESLEPYLEEIHRSILQSIHSRCEKNKKDYFLLAVELRWYEKYRDLILFLLLTVCLFFELLLLECHTFQ